MRVCCQVNAGAIAVISITLGFAACGSTQSGAPAVAPEPASQAASAAPLSEGAAPSSASSAAHDTSAAAPASAAPSASASAAPPVPDRTMNDIRAIVANNRDGFRGCYDRSAQAHPGIKGTYTLKFVLSPDGSVKSADADPSKSQIHAADLEACTVGVLKSLKFPPSRRGMESTVSYPFDFNPKVAPGSVAVPSKPAAP
jgi:outer membrane biosynthesis protein TonB